VLNVIDNYSQAERPMSIDALKEAIPDYAKDVRVNISNVLTSPHLTLQQLWGTALASALACGNGTVIRHIEAAAQLDETAKTATYAAASIMAMNNIYYRFSHLVSAPEYAQLPAGLRMTVIGNPGVDKVDFELWALAVSAITGCGMCIDSHERVLRDKGMGVEAIQAAIKIAAVIHAAARIIGAEEAKKLT
jgi:lipoyl-dependent peroxiredoxin subunit D